MTIQELVQKIARTETGKGKLYVYETPETGYFHAVLTMDAGTSSIGSPTLYPFLLAEMLDEGTKRLTRDEFRLSLERLGSDIRFELTPTKLNVRIEGMASAFETTMALVGEMLSSPLLSDDSYASVSERLKSEYEDEREDTRKIAHAELTSLLFSRAHPLTIVSPDEKIALLGASDAEGVRRFAEEYLRGRLDVIVVGDISRSRAEQVCSDSFSSFNSTAQETNALSLTLGNGGTRHLYVPGKENVDVFLGWNTDVRVGTTQYAELSVAVELLGGSGFTGHLMQTVRERDGLTYGIYARLRDATSTLPLYAYVWATFGNPLATRGIETTSTEIRDWLTSHITREKLGQKVSEIRGSYLVQFQDPEIIASKIAATVASGRELDDIAKFLEEIGTLSEDAVRTCAEKYLNPERAVRASAGSIRID